MALKKAPLAHETTTTTGTGSYTLAGAVDTERATFDQDMATGDTVHYMARGDGQNFEIGLGTFTAPSTLARTTIIQAVAGGVDQTPTPINWAPGTKDVYSLPDIELLGTSDFLLGANNLSDVQDATTARDNIGALDASDAVVKSGQDNQTVLGSSLKLKAGVVGPGRFIAEDNSTTANAWYGFRLNPNQGVIAHDDGTTERDILTFDGDELKALAGLRLAGFDGAVGYITATMASFQNTDLDVGDHVEFDTTIEDSGDISLSTGSGQQNGSFTVPPGVWLIILSLEVQFSSTGGSAHITIHNATQSNEISAPTKLVAAGNSALLSSSCSTVSGVLVNTANRVVYARIRTNGGLTRILGGAFAATQMTIIGLRRT